ncbi:Centromere protein F [Perkinsela sp. CCAP 1560/4]|nr:Centromere protein F [Perkinsela sp. CCAP 1560/4]|eukprot:KNH09797.1 Centromere protein F [Perkinsela sp. CCAP 1560/4]
MFKTFPSIYFFSRFTRLWFPWILVTDKHAIFASVAKNDFGMAFTTLSPLSDDLSALKDTEVRSVWHQLRIESSHLPHADPFDERLVGQNVHKLRERSGPRNSTAPVQSYTSFAEVQDLTARVSILGPYMPLIAGVTVRIPTEKISLEKLESMFFTLQREMHYYSSAQKEIMVSYPGFEQNMEEVENTRCSLSTLSPRSVDKKNESVYLSHDEWTSRFVQWCHGVINLMDLVAKGERFEDYVYIRCLGHPRVPFGAIIESGPAGMQVTVTYPKASQMVEDMCCHISDSTQSDQILESACDGVRFRTMKLLGRRSIYLFLACILNVRYNPHEELEKWDQDFIPETITAFPLEGSVKVSIHFSPVTRSHCGKWFFTGAHDTGMPIKSTFLLVERLYAESAEETECSFNFSHRRTSFYNYHQQKFIEKIVIADRPLSGYLVNFVRPPN